MAAPKTNDHHTRDVVEETEIRVKAHRWCKDSIGGAWSKISSDEMTMEPVRELPQRSEYSICFITPAKQMIDQLHNPSLRGTLRTVKLKAPPVSGLTGGAARLAASGGMTNYLYLCQLPKAIAPLRGEPHQVLLRIYGHITTSSMDVLVHNSVVFALLAEKRLGPKPYGMFFDGRIEEFIVARSLKHSDLSCPEIMKLVAERLANFHSLDMPLCKKPRWLFSAIKRWISEIQNNFSVHSNNRKKTESETLLRLQAIDIEKECNVLIEILSKVDSPVVFCHNDLQEGNILFNDKESDPDKRITIIDWEYGNYNYRGFDLANHFCEWMICYDEDSFYIEPERFPSRHTQYDFFRHYLKACGQETVSEEDLQKMYAETITFVLASHFLWGTWAIIQGHSSSIVFTYWDYAVSRFEEYFKLKERLPAMLAEGL